MTIKDKVTIIPKSAIEKVVVSESLVIIIFKSEELMREWIK